jgi:hypothetical protein
VVMKTLKWLDVWQISFLKWNSSTTLVFVHRGKHVKFLQTLWVPFASMICSESSVEVTRLIEGSSLQSSSPVENLSIPRLLSKSNRKSNICVSFLHRRIGNSNICPSLTRS